VKISGEVFVPEEADFAQDSRHFNLAFTISSYNSAIDGRNADSAALPHIEARRTR
jgi:hypothetical protein